MNSGQDNADKNSTGVLWGAAFLIAIIFGIWYAFKLELIQFYVSLKYYELLFLQFFSTLPFLPQENLLLDMLDYLEEMHNPYAPNLEIVLYIGKNVGFFMNIFFSIIAFFMTYKLWHKNSVTRFIKTHSMDTLAKQEQRNWTMIAPVIGENLVNIDIKKGPWSMADTPLQFCKKHKLLEIETISDRKFCCLEAIVL